MFQISPTQDSHGIAHCDRFGAVCAAVVSEQGQAPYVWSMQTRLAIETRGPGLYEFTERVQDFVRETDAGNGLLAAFVRHTSCSLLVQENADPDVQRDLKTFFSRLVPPSDAPSMAWVTHTMEGPDDMPAHIKAALMAVSLAIPVNTGGLALGTWQGIYLFEHRDRPHSRNVVLHLSP